MSAFRKFDPYTFLADQEGGGAPSEAAPEAPETLASLATLAGEHHKTKTRGLRMSAASTNREPPLLKLLNLLTLSTRGRKH